MLSCICFLLSLLSVVFSLKVKYSVDSLGTLLHFHRVSDISYEIDLHRITSLPVDFKIELVKGSYCSLINHNVYILPVKELNLDTYNQDYFTEDVNGESSNPEDMDLKDTDIDRTIIDPNKCDIRIFQWFPHTQLTGVGLSIDINSKFKYIIKNSSISVKVVDTAFNSNTTDVGIPSTAEYFPPGMVDNVRNWKIRNGAPIPPIVLSSSVISILRSHSITIGKPDILKIHEIVDMYNSFAVDVYQTMTSTTIVPDIKLVQLDLLSIPIVYILNGKNVTLDRIGVKPSSDKSDMFIGNEEQVEVEISNMKKFVKNKQNDIKTTSMNVESEHDDDFQLIEPYSIYNSNSSAANLNITVVYRTIFSIGFGIKELSSSTQNIINFKEMLNQNAAVYYEGRFVFSVFRVAINTACHNSNVFCGEGCIGCLTEGAPCQVNSNCFGSFAECRDNQCHFSTPTDDLDNMFLSGSTKVTLLGVVICILGTLMFVI